MNMTFRRIAVTAVGAMLVALISVLAVGGPACAAQKARLKLGAKGQQCLKCHEKQQKEFHQRSTHPLGRTNACIGCHDPHTSSHENLLVEDVQTLCNRCHAKILPENARSRHKVVVEGNCAKCHNAHGSDNRFLLIKSGNELCVQCHAQIGERLKAIKFPHKPVSEDKGCLNCHSPHASTRADFLLKNDASALCTTCHKTNRPIFARRHMNYKVDNSNCNSCHNPHGSDRRNILYAAVHAPVAEKKCQQCHNSPTAPNALGVKQKGTALCLQCHKPMIDEAYAKKQVHWPLADSTGCLHCHNPHGSKAPKLLNGPQAKVCGQCHADTVELQQWSVANPQNKHLCEPIRKGTCSSCHGPHSADNLLLMPRENISIDVCGKCHEWESHSTHPIGAKVVDQRNKNLTVECLSCHVGCGTANKPSMLPFDTTYELCVQCHVERKR